MPKILFTENTSKLRFLFIVNDSKSIMRGLNKYFYKI